MVTYCLTTYPYYRTFNNGRRNWRQMSSPSLRSPNICTDVHYLDTLNDDTGTSKCWYSKLSRDCCVNVFNVVVSLLRYNDPESGSLSPPKSVDQKNDDISRWESYILYLRKMNTSTKEYREEYITKVIYLQKNEDSKEVFIWCKNYGKRRNYL